MRRRLFSEWCVFCVARIIRMHTKYATGDEISGGGGVDSDSKTFSFSLFMYAKVILHTEIWIINALCGCRFHIISPSPRSFVRSACNCTIAHVPLHRAHFYCTTTHCWLMVSLAREPVSCSFFPSVAPRHHSLTLHPSPLRLPLQFVAANALGTEPSHANYFMNCRTKRITTRDKQVENYGTLMRKRKCGGTYASVHRQTTHTHAPNAFHGRRLDGLNGSGGRASETERDRERDREKCACGIIIFINLFRVFVDVWSLYVAPSTCTSIKRMVW